MDSNQLLSVKTAKEALKFIEFEWNAAALQFSVDKLAAVYSDDALMFGGRRGHSVGRDSIFAYYDSYVGVLKSMSLHLIDQHIIVLGPEAFLAQGFAEAHFVLAGGAESDNVLRTTLALARRHGNWKIVEHHFSPTPEVPAIPKWPGQVKTD